MLNHAGDSNRSYCDPKAAEARCAMLPPLEESAVEPAELEQQAQRSSRLVSKLAANAADKKQEYVGFFLAVVLSPQTVLTLFL
jgi:predicted ATP-grasp superfamily ATP-dependent carboligase